jgi:hypothetical protein
VLFYFLKTLVNTTNILNTWRNIAMCIKASWEYVYIYYLMSTIFQLEHVDASRFNECARASSSETLYLCPSTREASKNEMRDRPHGRSTTSEVQQQYHFFIVTLLLLRGHHSTTHNNNQRCCRSYPVSPLFLFSCSSIRHFLSSTT